MEAAIPIIGLLASVVNLIGLVVHCLLDKRKFREIEK